MAKYKLMKWTGALVAVSMLISAMSGCSAPAPKPAGNFIEGDISGGEAETLNWILAADASSFGYVGYTLESLAGYDNKFNIVLRCLARDIEASPDGLVYTINIRPDLEWSDGSQVTSEDYVYTLKNLMFSGWLNYNYKDDWQEDVDGAKQFVVPAVVDNTTFTVTRRSVQPEFIYTLYDLMPYPSYLTAIYLG